MIHANSSTASRSRHPRRALPVLLGALLLLALAQAAPALAAPSFIGGATEGDYPLYVANDHSVYALRFSAEELTPSTEYNMKVRISPTASVSGGSSRGFTWNPTSQQWIQERDEWSLFPAITTDAAGAYVSGNVWTFFKFGDTTKPAKDTSSEWYIVVSVQPVGGGSGTTQNSATARAVTLVDMTGDLSWATPAFRVHNADATGASKVQRVEAAAAGGTDVLSVSRCKPNGVVEGYGGVDTGDFDIAVPAGVAFDARVSSTTWSVSDFTGTLADVDIALGADDTTPPVAPTGFTSTVAGTTTSLSWDSVADAASYTVYQWQDATPIDNATNYTPQHVAVGSTTATTYEATGLTEDEGYHFEVRAVDAAGNIGPRSRYPSELSLRTSKNTVDWGGGATLSGDLTDGAEPFVAGQEIALELSYDGATWTALPGLLSPVSPFAYSATVLPTRSTQYRFVFASDGVHQATSSDPVTVTPRVKLGRPVAPKAVKRGRKFTAYGSLVPKHASGSKTVRIKCYQKKSGKWKLRRTVRAANRNYRTYSRYSAKLALPARGSWKLVAYSAPSSKYASKTSSARYVRVK